MWTHGVDEMVFLLEEMIDKNLYNFRAIHINNAKKYQYFFYEYENINKKK